jgi:hypothetical protein
LPRAGACPQCGKAVWLTQDSACPDCLTPLASDATYRAVAQCPSPPRCPPPTRSAIARSDLDAALAAVSGAWDDLVRARSVVPFPGPGAVGAVSLPMPPFYRQFGLNSTVVLFEHPLTSIDADRIANAGRSINEGYLLRLHAILDAAGLLQAVLDKDDQVESLILLIKDVRNEIAHGRRECEPDDKRQRKLVERLIAALYPDELVGREPLLKEERESIDRDLASGSPFGWPLSILGVLSPLTSATSAFIRASRGEV